MTKGIQSKIAVRLEENMFKEIYKIFTNIKVSFGGQGEVPSDFT